MSYTRRAYTPDESIYGLIPSPIPASTRSSMHRSKYSPNIPPTASTFGAAATSTINASNLSGEFAAFNAPHKYHKPCATFGSKTSTLPDPQVFLKKQSQPDLPQPTRHTYTDIRKPPVPIEATSYHFTSSASADSSPSSRSSNLSNSIWNSNRSRRNFISENALSVIMSDARKPVCSSINYLSKPDYGQVPEYLESVKKEMTAERDYIRSVVASAREEEQKYQPRLQLLSEEERVRLLTDLKLKWEGVNRAYQGITHIVTLDTTGKVRRKEEYETELGQLEKAIERLSKKHVFVQE